MQGESDKIYAERYRAYEDAVYSREICETAYQDACYARSIATEEHESRCHDLYRQYSAARAAASEAYNAIFTDIPKP
jgi:hypothetical protein